MATGRWSDKDFLLMRPEETYRRLAERAQQAADNARDPEAKRLLENAAQRWRQLAEFAERNGAVQQSDQTGKDQ